MSSIERSIEVAVPVSAAYNQWTQFEEFPRFMEGVEEVHQLDATHLHWRAEVGFKDKEWEAEIVEQVPDQRIAWRSTTGAENGGTVTFQPLAARQTLVTLQLNYAPAGLLENVGDALGVVSRRVEGDLRRFKEFIEARGTATGGWRGAVEDREPTASTEDSGAVISATGAVYGSTAGRNVEETAIPVVEENLHISTQPVESGGVRINPRVTESPVNEQVQLRDEHVEVARRPVDRPASDADYVPDGTLEVRELHEHPVVERHARVVEEVVVSKQVQPRVETVQDTVRHKDVAVEQLSGQTTSTGSTETGRVTEGGVADVAATAPAGVRTTTTDARASAGMTSTARPADVSTITQSQHTSAARPVARRDVRQPTLHALDTTATSLRRGDIRGVLEALRASVHRYPLRSVAIGLSLGYLATRTFAGGSGAQSRKQPDARGSVRPPAPPRAVPMSAMPSGTSYGAGAASQRVMPAVSGTSAQGASALAAYDTLEVRPPEAPRGVTGGTLAASTSTTATGSATLDDAGRPLGPDAAEAAASETGSTTTTATPTAGDLPTVAPGSAGVRGEPGGVVRTRLTTSVENVPATAAVTLRDEQVHVERRPVDRPASDADYVPDGTLEVRELHEHPVVERHARVVEEVVVNTQIREHTEPAPNTAYPTNVGEEQIGGEQATTDSPATGTRSDLGNTEHG